MNNAIAIAVGQIVVSGNTMAPSQAKILSILPNGDVKVRHLRSVRGVSVIEKRVFDHCYFATNEDMIAAYAAR